MDSAFIEAHATGLEQVASVLGPVDVTAYAEICGLDPDEIRRTAREMAAAPALASFEDLGVQMKRHSRLVSCLHKLTWLLTGNLGKPGTHNTVTALVPIASGKQTGSTRVTGARIIGNLIPCNTIVEEVLTDHPDRFQGMIVESGNPAHSMADSTRFVEALEALDCVVVIDIATTETARHVDYVLPASTQFEKAEATFFNFEFPRNVLHLRRALMPPADGALPEAEIHGRLCEALGATDGLPLDELVAAAEQDLEACAMAFGRAAATHPTLMGLAPAVLYRTLGPSLPRVCRTA